MFLTLFESWEVEKIAMSKSFFSKSFTSKRVVFEKSTLIIFLFLMLSNSLIKICSFSPKKINPKPF